MILNQKLIKIRFAVLATVLLIGLYFLVHGASSREYLSTNIVGKQDIAVSIPSGFKRDNHSGYLSNSNIVFNYGSDDEATIFLSKTSIYAFASSSSDVPVSVGTMVKLLDQCLLKGEGEPYYLVILQIKDAVKSRLGDYHVTFSNFERYYNFKYSGYSGWKTDLVFVVGSESYSGSALVALSSNHDVLYNFIIVAKSKIWDTNRIEWENVYSSAMLSI